jgi:hypothetical protein
MSIENGVVQGAVLSVTLFLVESYTRANGHHEWLKTSYKKQPMKL